VRIRELLKKIRLRLSTQGEAKRLADSKEQAWGTFMPSQEDDRPRH
jgi:hypothetical protein